ncbi:MAG: hypothetical protein LBM66_00470 [Bifidobacteriaceae bacterium]|jgi:hypothetical protein|nr:hypothetical protein [Bifidobacteriaceae bacterium]
MSKKHIKHQAPGPGGRRRIANQAGAPDRRVIPRQGTESIAAQPFRWSARHMGECPAVTGTTWDLRGEAAHQILSLLEDLTAKTWAEVMNLASGGHRLHHSEPADGLTSRGAAQWYISQGIERAYRLRVTARARLWGFRQGGTFNILWFDPDHQLHGLPAPGDRGKQRR